MQGSALVFAQAHVQKNIAGNEVLKVFMLCAELLGCVVCVQQVY